MKNSEHVPRTVDPFKADIVAQVMLFIHDKFSLWDKNPIHTAFCDLMWFLGDPVPARMPLKGQVMTALKAIRPDLHAPIEAFAMQCRQLFHAERYGENNGE